MMSIATIYGMIAYIIAVGVAAGAIGEQRGSASVPRCPRRAVLSAGRVYMLDASSRYIRSVGVGKTEVSCWELRGDGDDPIAVGWDVADQWLHAVVARRMVDSKALFSYYRVPAKALVGADGVSAKPTAARPATWVDGRLRLPAGALGTTEKAGAAAQLDGIVEPFHVISGEAGAEDPDGRLCGVAVAVTASGDTVWVGAMTRTGTYRTRRVHRVWEAVVRAGGYEGGALPHMERSGRVAFVRSPGPSLGPLDGVKGPAGLPVKRAASTHAGEGLWETVFLVDKDRMTEEIHTYYGGDVAGWRWLSSAPLEIEPKPRLPGGVPASGPTGDAPRETIAVLLGTLGVGKGASPAGGAGEKSIGKGVRQAEVPADALIRDRLQR